MKPIEQQKTTYVCPICGKTLADKENPRCQNCGWAYGEGCQDDGQISAKNYVTPKQYKEIFSSLRKKHPDYSYHDDPDLLEEAQLAYMRKNAIPHPNDGWRYEKPCPVCGERIIHFEYDICPICGWELDPVQTDDPDFWGGANNLSLNDFRNLFLELRKENRSYRWEDDPSIREKREKEIFAKYIQSEDDVSK